MMWLLLPTIWFAFALWPTRTERERWAIARDALERMTR